jgi:hypothetical protein
MSARGEGVARMLTNRTANVGAYAASTCYHRVNYISQSSTQDVLQCLVKCECVSRVVEYVGHNTCKVNENIYTGCIH